VQPVKTETDAAPDELTRNMIDIGSRLLAERGVVGLSLRKLAALAGTSTMSVYTRFGSKQQLLEAMYREGFRRLGAALAQAAQQGDGAAAITDTPTLQTLAGAGLAYRRAALASPTLYGLMFGAAAPGFTPSAADDAAAGATYEPFRVACRLAVAHGVLAGDPERIALHLWSVAHGMVSLEIARRIDAADAEQLYAEALELAATPFLVNDA
jgi:AcrR family transcriptional regulator